LFKSQKPNRTRVPVFRPFRLPHSEKPRKLGLSVKVDGN